MAIQPIRGIDTIAKLDAVKPQSKGTAFKTFFDTALSGLESTNQLQKEADSMSIDFALGRIDNVADVMIAQEKASVAMQYTVQLRNKLLDAYNEIMRIQV